MKQGSENAITASFLEIKNYYIYSGFHSIDSQSRKAVCRPFMEKHNGQFVFSTIFWPNLNLIMTLYGLSPLAFWILKILFKCLIVSTNDESYG